MTSTNGDAQPSNSGRQSVPLLTTEDDLTDIKQMLQKVMIAQDFLLAKYEERSQQTPKNQDEEAKHAEVKHEEALSAEMHQEWLSKISAGQEPAQEDMQAKNTTKVGPQLRMRLRSYSGDKKDPRFFTAFSIIGRRFKLMKVVASTVYVRGQLEDRNGGLYVSRTGLVHEPVPSSTFYTISPLGQQSSISCAR